MSEDMRAMMGMVAIVVIVAVVCSILFFPDAWRKPEPDLSRCAFCGQKTNF